MGLKSEAARAGARVQSAQADDHEAASTRSFHRQPVAVHPCGELHAEQIHAGGETDERGDATSSGTFKPAAACTGAGAGYQQAGTGNHRQKDVSRKKSTLVSVRSTAG